MRNVFLLLLIIPFFSLGCSSDYEESLDGTIWMSVEKSGYFSFRSTAIFSKTTYTYSGYDQRHSYSEKEEFFGSGTYVYDHPNIVFTENGESSTCLISGNKMKAINSHEDTIPIEYTKVNE